MITAVLSVILGVSILMSLALGAYTMVRCDYREKPVFVSLLFFVTIYILGYLLEINANTADGGFVAVKVIYFGSSFMAPLLLMFIAGYCRIKIPKLLIAFLLCFSLFILVALWTTDIHKLFYSSYEMNFDYPVRSLAKERDIINTIGHIQVFGCTLASVFIVGYRYISKKGRRPPWPITTGILLGVVTHIYYFLGLSSFGINYVPLAMFIALLLFSLSIFKYNIFNIINRASELAVSSMAEAFILVDADGRFIDSNESARELFASLKSVSENTPVSQIEGWPEELDIACGNKGGLVQFTMNDGKFYKASISPVLAENRNLLGYVILAQDITESALFTRKLEEMAYNDSLTGILNRSSFTSLALAQFKRVKRTGRGSFVIMLDIDHFKNINDTYGHPFGDHVLVSIAERIKEILRPYDLFARYGGEEFILYITDVTGKSVMELAERARHAVCGTPMEIQGVKLTVSASFGVAPVGIGEDTFHDAVRYADEALYRAKREGRNRVVMY